MNYHFVVGIISGYFKQYPVNRPVVSFSICIPVNISTLSLIQDAFHKKSTCINKKSFCISLFFNLHKQRKTMFLKILMLNNITTSITQSRKCSSFVRINIRDGHFISLYFTNISYFIWYFCWENVLILKLIVVQSLTTKVNSLMP